MKIKRIEITGFKSFVENTTLVFGKGVTAIVGPNGCGKSNVVDAIRWVMGEQSARNLRGKAMEDVIFGGSENRKPFGMAEVSLILDNSDGQAPPGYRDYAEIQVTRRLYRNGDSEYLLNKAPCRLLDVTELFMDTGIGSRAYSIIEQGKIGMIVNAKPEERRSLIEEAAGVTKYKARRKTALRKIEATRQNLLRLGDIIAEVKRQMNSLKRQAGKAERYKEFRDELKGIELQFALRRYGKLAGQGREAGCAADEKNRQVEHLAGQLETAELSLDQARLAHVEREKDASRAQEQVFHLTGEIQKVESRLEFSAREVDALISQKERFATEYTDIKAQLESLQTEEAELFETRAAVDRELGTQQEHLAATENQLQGLEEQERLLQQRLEEARSRLYNLLTELSRRGGQQTEADRRLQALEGLQERNRQEALAVRQQIDKLQVDSGGLTDTLSGMISDRDQLVRRRQELREELISLQQGNEDVDGKLLVQREELSRQRSRLESLEQLERNLEGYDRGVKTLLSHPEQKQRLSGVVADLLEVPAEYETAVEAVLGSRLQALLTEQVGSIEAAFAVLREEEGRCTFLVPGFELVHSDSDLPGEPLSGLVKTRSGCEETLLRLLAGVRLVEDLRPYLGGGFPPGTVLATRHGEVLTGRGEITGGGRQSLDQGMLHKKREMKNLGLKVKSLVKEVDGLNERRARLREDLAAAEEQLRSTEADLHRQELGVMDREKDLAGLRQETTRLQERLETLSFEEDQLHEEEQGLQRLLEEARSGHSAAEKEKVEQEEVVAGLNRENQSIRLQTEQVRQQVTAAKVALVGLKERDQGIRETLDRIGKTREQLQQRQSVLVSGREEADAKITALQQEQEQLKKELEALHAQRVEKQTAQADVRDRFEASRRDLDQREEDIRKLRSRLNQAREELASDQLKHREVAMECEHLRQSFLERYRLDLDEPAVAERLEDDFDESSAGQRREYLKKRIEDIGEVNLTAIEEFRELEERYNFLTSQQDDLLKSLEGLQSAITKINRTTRKRFREAFDQINGRFRELFPQMFNGGQAELRLTDEDDLLETGIEIAAQPPGKKLQNVSLLSGGEKALTAVALIFSIFQVKPSPFCLLDEVDAPLDDMNIGRFNEAVRQMTTDSQFILITHNKRTMEIADNLYGVTMEDPGVSKLVSVRMREAA